MGASLCRSPDAADAPKANEIWSPCTCVPDDTDLEIEITPVYIEKFVLKPEDDESLVTALSEFKEALRLFRAGDCKGASKHLEKAESLLEAASSSSPSRQQMMDAAAGDSEIKELKLVIKADPTTDEVDLSFALNAIEDSEDEASVAEPASPAEGSPGCGTESVGGVFAGTPSTARAKKTAMRSAKLETLEGMLANVLSFCKEARTFEAHAELERLETTLADELKTAEEEDDKFVTILKTWAEQLRARPLILKLRSLHLRVQAGLKLINAKAGKSKSEVKLEAKEPKISADFKLRLSIRFAEGDERDKDGPQTQLIIRGDMQNYPATLSKLITENIETDLFQKEWCKDCKVFYGKAGRAHQLFCAVAHGIISPALLPIKVEDVLLREFCVDKEGVHTDRGPGVVVIEHRAPDGATEFEGITIPPKKRGIIRIKGGMTAFFKSKGQKEGCSNIMAVSTMGLPVPQWMLPLSLLKKFAADLLVGSSINLCQGLYNKWEETEYSKRNPDTCPDLYRLIASLPADKVDTEAEERQTS